VAFRTANGTPVYILLEDGYDKKDGPARSRWTCVAFGRWVDVLRWIMMAVSSAGCGMLQSVSGEITPHGYLRRWIEAAQAPLEVPGHKLLGGAGVLRVAPFKGFDWWEESKVEAETRNALMRAVLARYPGNQQRLADFSAGREIAFSLYEDGDMLLDILGDVADTDASRPRIAPWRMNLTPEKVRGGEANCALNPFPYDAVSLRQAKRKFDQFFKDQRLQVLVLERSPEMPWYDRFELRHTFAPLDRNAVLTGSRSGIVRDLLQWVASDCADFVHGTRLPAAVQRFERLVDELCDEALPGHPGERAA
jgi:hypothetical protein